MDDLLLYNESTELMESLEAEAFTEPFPHLIIKNLYNKNELELIWEELKFYTKPGKLLDAKNFGGVVDKTNSHAINLDEIYIKDKFRHLSSILCVNRKVFSEGILEAFASIHDCCSIAVKSNWDYTKVRYYHNGEYYKPHTDYSMPFLAFSYFYKEPKKFEGGEIYFPKYEYELTCENNSVIILPGWVEHGVKEVKIENSDYYDGWGRYCISSFFGSRHTAALNQPRW
tara:strand:+ start:282 stop:965 length:684 start_codon:yes stop_codon:yes gene_type:complete